MFISAVLFGFNAAVSLAAEPRKPNIVVILADDLGYADLGCQGCKDIPTPNIDILAKNGVRCTSGYSNHPVCSPSRAGLMTGLYPQRFGFEHNSGPEKFADPKFGVPKTVPILAEKLKAAGYATGMVGKWHIGFKEGLRPHERGFDFHFGFLSGAHTYLPGKKDNDPLVRNGKPVDGEKEYLTDAFAREALGFIERSKEKPFFLYVAFNAVHAPLEATSEYEKRFPEIKDAKRKTYAGMLSAMDDAVGKVLGKLRELKLEEDTLIVFYSDNGGPTPQTTSRNDPLRGFKAQMYEGGIRVPFLWQWKGTLPAGKVYDPAVMGFDVHATALAAAGVEVPKDKPLDGVNLLPYLTGKQSGEPHDKLFWRAGQQHAARVGDWKLVSFRGTSQLFNLKDDIGEKTDLAAKEPAKLKELEGIYSAWDKQMMPPLWVRQDAKNPGPKKDEPKKEEPKKEDPKADDTIATRFKQLDTNSDGKLSAEELKKGTPAVQRRLKGADKNKDGFLTLEEVRAHLGGTAPPAKQPEVATMPKPEPAKVEIVKTANIPYATVKGVDANLLSLDICSLQGAADRPVMIYVHGGGWRTGDKRAIQGKADYFTKRGFVFVSVNYRLVPAVDILTQLQDSANAVGWVQKNIAQHGGDPKQLHLIGHSAGAHHVAILATNERFLKAAGVTLSNIKSVVELDTQALDVPAMMAGTDNALYLQAFGKEPKLWKEVSPRDHVAKDKGIPPFFLVVANERGPKLKQATAFQNTLEEAGIRCEFVEAPEHDHGSLNRAIGEAKDKVTQAMEQFHDSIQPKKSGAAPTKPHGAFAWEPSLSFDADKTKDGPLPVNAMQLVVHRDMLFCGMATSFERDRYSRGSSYIYSKASKAPWKLEADFGPGTSRVGQMFSARFERDGTGKPLAGGPKQVLVAFTMNGGRLDGEPTPLQMRVRDDATGKWETVALPTPKVADSNVRELWLHRDAVTGADLLFVCANPSPLGIYRGSFDETAPARIRWHAEPEIKAQGRRGTSKWFGMATVNGVLLASDVDSVYRREDGPNPRWTKVVQFPRGVGNEGGAEVRGLTAVPNPKALTNWSEKEMLLLAVQMKLWRLRVPEKPDAKHDQVAELELVPWLGKRLGEPVVFAESAFNRLTPFRPSPDAAPVWPIGFQVVYPVPGKTLSNQDPESYRLKDEAWFLLRDEKANYTLHRIESDRRLFLARDFKPSPFPEEPHTLYACGYNGSYFKGSLGTAWIYHGELPNPKQPTTKEK
jgi:arylsulfatase A-like enzyme/acetyl esterase/lipase